MSGDLAASVLSDPGRAREALGTIEEAGAPESPPPKRARPKRVRPKGVRNRAKISAPAAVPSDDPVVAFSGALQGALAQSLRLAGSFAGGPPDVWEVSPEELRAWGDAVAPVLLPAVIEHADRFALASAVLATGALLAPRYVAWQRWRQESTREQ